MLNPAQKFLRENFLPSKLIRASRQMIAPIQNRQPPLLKQPRSNTLILAVKYKDGVAVAADKRVTNSHLEIISDDYTKIEEISKFSVMGCAGHAVVAKELLEIMRSTCKMFEQRAHQELSPDGQVNYLRSLVRSQWMFNIANWHNEIGAPILACYDAARNEPRIFTCSCDGFCYEIERFTGCGCGYSAIEKLIAKGWESALDRSGALDLAMEAMVYSASGSGGVSDPRLSLPDIATINRTGVGFLEEDEIGNLLEKIGPQIRFTDGGVV